MNARQFFDVFPMVVQAVAQHRYMAAIGPEPTVRTVEARHGAKVANEARDQFYRLVEAAKNGGAL